MTKYRYLLVLLGLINHILISPCYSAFSSSKNDMSSLLIQDKAMKLANDVNSARVFSSSCTVTSIAISVDCPPVTPFTWNNGTLHIVSGGHYQLNGSNIFNACSFVWGGMNPSSQTITATFSTTACGTSSLSCTTILNCNGFTCNNVNCIPT